MIHASSRKGIMMILMSNFAFTGMVIFLRLAAVENVALSALIRFFVGILVIVSMAFTGGIVLRFNDRKGLIIRGLLGGSAIGLGFLGIYQLGLIQGTVLMNTFPVFAVIFSMIHLGERPGVRKLITVVIAFVGIVLTIVGKGDSLIEFQLNGYSLLALLGGALGGAAVVQVKKISKTEMSEAIFLAQCLGGIFLMGIPAVTMPIALPVGTLPILLLMGICATLGQLLFTHGVRTVSVATTSVLTLTGPVLSVLAGKILFGELLTPIMGGGIVITMGSLLIISLPSKPKVNLSNELSS